ncbi:hypothetical protein HQQ80_10325 [Microbacteriaceae bacterium VKM Ac-2855]|nr:hypothetical protein [Microbacteriaceae bacterium VKM Ac-2855]
MVPKLSARAMLWWGVGGIVASIALGLVYPNLLYQAQVSGSSILDVLFATVPALNRLLFGLGIAFVAAAFVVRHLEPRAPARTNILSTDDPGRDRDQPRAR